MNKIITHLNKQQHTFHLVTVSPWPIVTSLAALALTMILLAVIVLSAWIGMAYFCGGEVAAEEIFTFHFNGSQLGQLRVTLAEELVKLKKLGRSFDSRVFFRLLDEELFNSVQKWVVKYFPQLHQAVLDARSTGVKFDSQMFIQNVSVNLPGPLGQASQYQLQKFCEIYKHMIDDYALLLDTLQKKKQVDSNALACLLGNAFKANYLIHHGLK